MQPMRPSRHSVYVLALVVILLSQQIVSQTQSPPPPGTNSSATSNTRPPGKANCTNNGTYVSSKRQTVQRPENCSAPPQGATAQCRDGTYSFSQSRRGTCGYLLDLHTLNLDIDYLCVDVQQHEGKPLSGHGSARRTQHCSYAHRGAQQRGIPAIDLCSTLPARSYCRCFGDGFAKPLSLQR